MLVHNHPEFAIRVVKAILSPRNHVIIHVDRKASDVYKKIKVFAESNNNVHLIDFEQSVYVNWGGFSIVNATLIGMQYAMDKKLEFDYLGMT